MQPPQIPEPKQPGWLAYLVVAASPLLPILVLVLIAIFGSHSAPKGYCEGIGFGCVPSPSDAAQLMLLFAALPGAVAQIAVGCGVLALLRLWGRYRRLPVLVQGLIPSTPMIALAIILLVST